MLTDSSVGVMGSALVGRYVAYMAVEVCGHLGALTHVCWVLDVATDCTGRVFPDVEGCHAEVCPGDSLAALTHALLGLLGEVW